jgi:hypothetical protein
VLRRIGDGKIRGAGSVTLIVEGRTGIPEQRYQFYWGTTVHDLTGMVGEGENGEERHEGRAAWLDRVAHRRSRLDVDPVGGKPGDSNDH